MKYVIDLPDEIEQALERRAQSTGSGVGHIINAAVVSFLRADVKLSKEGRLPDPPLEPIEIVAPFDLPYTNPQPISIQIQSSRRPDPIADPT